VQRWVVGILIVVLVAFVVRSLWEIEPELHRPFAPEGWGAAVGVVGLILVSFTGFEKISTVAEEVKKPGRNLPIAIIGSVIVATLLYGAVLFVFTGLVPWQEIEPDETALVEASGEALGSLGYYGMLGAGLLATLSSANAAVLASSRICFAMGRDRILPGWLGKVHEDHGTPHRAILLTAALSLALGLSGGAARLAEISSSLFIVSYALIAVGVLAMRKVGTDYDPPFRVPLYPVLPALGGLAALAVLATLETISLLVGLALAVASLAWYFLWARKRTEVQGAVGGWLRQQKPLRSLVHGGESPTRRPGRHVMVGFAEKEGDPMPLLRLGCHIASGLDADLDAVRVRLVPEAVGLDRAWDEIHEEGKGDPDEPLAERLNEVTGGNVEIHAHTRPARSLAHGVLGATETVGSVELILLAEDSPTLTRGADAEVRSDYSGDVAVLSRKAPEAVEPHTVRVGVSSSPRAALALRLAQALARSTGARVELVRIVTGDDEFADEASVRRWATENGSGDGDTPPVRLEHGPDVAEGLTRLARDSNLLVVGAGQHPLRGGRIGRTARHVRRNSQTPVLVVWKGEEP
jgi:nucleotide-binding universal stress UspA family protein